MALHAGQADDHLRELLSQDGYFSRCTRRIGRGDLLIVTEPEAPEPPDERHDAQTDEPVVDYIADLDAADDAAGVQGGGGPTHRPV